jgi:hypothetical protein
MVVIDYEVTLEYEVLCECAAGVSAAYGRYCDAHNIHILDKNNPYACAALEAWRYMDQMLACNTLEELQPFADRLHELNDIAPHSGLAPRVPEATGNQ